MNYSAVARVGGEVSSQ